MDDLKRCKDSGVDSTEWTSPSCPKYPCRAWVIANKFVKFPVSRTERQDLKRGIMELPTGTH